MRKAYTKSINLIVSDDAQVFRRKEMLKVRCKKNEALLGLDYKILPCTIIYIIVHKKNNFVCIPCKQREYDISS